MDCEEEDEEEDKSAQLVSCDVTNPTSFSASGLLPKVTPDQILSFFGGNVEIFNYYVSLKAALSTTIKCKGDEPCHWDPRATEIGQRLRSSRWAPSIVLKPVPDVCDVSGFSSKQTALDDRMKEEEEEEEDGCGRDTVVAGEKMGNVSGNEQGEVMDNGDERNGCFVCGIQGCNGEFSSLASYESHYHTSHNFVCSVCKRVFVSDFLLDVHLGENHDSYFQILSPRIDMYRCLVESCSLKFRTPDLRKDHLVTTHKFPASFSFHRPIKEKSKKKTRKRGKDQSGAPSDVNSSATPAVETSSLLGSGDHRIPSPRAFAMDVDAGNEDKTQQRGKRGGRRGRGRGNKIPPTICFGRGSQKAFVSRGGHGGRHWYQVKGEADTKIDIENVDMTDMLESLDS